MGGQETQPEKSFTTTNTSYRLQFEDYIGKDNGSLTDSYKPLIGWEAHQLHLNDRRQNNKHRPELQHALLIFIHVSLQKKSRRCKWIRDQTLTRKNDEAPRTMNKTKNHYANLSWGWEGPANPIEYVGTWEYLLFRFLYLLWLYCYLIFCLRCCCYCLFC